MPELPPEDAMTPHEKDTALLDLLAGWLEFISASQEDAHEDYGEFQEIFEHTSPEHHQGFRAHYTQAYTERVHELYRAASEQVLGDADSAPQLSPADFIRQHILPLFGEDA